MDCKLQIPAQLIYATGSPKLYCPYRVDVIKGRYPELTRTLERTVKDLLPESHLLSQVEGRRTSQILADAFTWCETEQGFTYWGDICSFLISHGD